MDSYRYVIHGSFPKLHNVCEEKREPNTEEGGCTCTDQTKLAGF